MATQYIAYHVAREDLGKAPAGARIRPARERFAAELRAELAARLPVGSLIEVFPRAIGSDDDFIDTPRDGVELLREAIAAVRERGAFWQPTLGSA